MSVKTEKYIECDANQCGEIEQFNGNNFITFEFPRSFNTRDNDKRLSDAKRKSGEKHFCTMDCMLTYIRNEIYNLEGMFSHE